MGGGWKDYAEFLEEPDRSYWMMELNYGDHDGDFDDYDEYQPYQTNRRSRDPFKKIKCRYCKDSFAKNCSRCGPTCKPPCPGTLTKHTCIFRYFCDVCQKRFATKGELDSGTHGFRQNGVVVDCNLWTAGETVMGRRVYSTKASQEQTSRKMAPIIEKWRKELELGSALNATNEQDTMNPDAAVFIPGAGVHCSKSG